MTDWRALRGKAVRVAASGVEFRGVVVELGEHSLVLRSPSGVREIPWAQIVRVEEDRAPTGFAPLRRG